MECASRGFLVNPLPAGSGNKSQIFRRRSLWQSPSAGAGYFDGADEAR